MLEQGGTLKIRMLLAAIAIAGGAALASACNDDGEALTLEEYFERVDELDQAEQDRSAEVEQEFEELPDDAPIDEYADRFERQIDSLETFASDMDDIEPPDEVADLHDDVVSALNEATDTFGGVVEEFRDAGSLEEGFAVLDGVDDSAIQRATDACLDLEQIAADNNIDADFDCGENE